MIQPIEWQFYPYNVNQLSLINVISIHEMSIQTRTNSQNSSYNMDYLIVYTSLGPIHIFSIYLSLSRPKRKTIYLCSFLINFLFKLKVVKKQNSKYTMLIPYKHWQKHYVHYKQRDKLAENSMVRGCSIIYNQLQCTVPPVL